jgi:glycosyltransferase involved in cell wall biosynthesis
MYSKPLISIIIPVYNREKLLAFTLNSIIQQSFVDWECIVVDDQSTDGTFLVMQHYQSLDSRIKIFRRPFELRKGANSCRNYGFLQTNGAYIKWFDSDDLMLTMHLEIAYNALVENNLDFVVTDTENFDHDTQKLLGKPYNFDRDKAIITAENYALGVIGWITDDFLGRREIIKNVKFNEYITDGDEYNFFIKLFQKPFQGIFINDILTHRRIHNGSITLQNLEFKKKYDVVITILKFQTAQDLVIYKDKKLIRWFLAGYMRYSFELAQDNEQIPFLIPAFKLICKYYSISKGFIFLSALFLGKYFNKGYNVMKYARN